MKRLITLALCFIGLASCYSQPKQHSSAKIIDISQRPSRWHANEVIVTFRSHDGLIGKRTMLVSEVRCRVGDTVSVDAQGIALTMSEGGCR